MPATETPVKLEVRMTPANVKRRERLMLELAARVKFGKLTYEQASQRMADFNQEYTEFRLDGGPWRSLREA